MAPNFFLRQAEQLARRSFAHYVKNQTGVSFLMKAMQ